MREQIKEERYKIKNYKKENNELKKETLIKNLYFQCDRKEVCFE